MKYTPDMEGVGLPGLDRSTTWLLGTVFAICSAVLYGDATFAAYGFNISQFFNSALATFGPISISWASVLSVAAIVGVYIGNTADITEFRDHQTTLGIVTLAGVVLTALSSDVMQLVSGGTSGLIWTAVLFVGYLSMVEVPALEGGKQ